MRIRVHARGGQQETVEIDKNPDTCPLCRHGIDPTDVQHAFYSEKSLSPIGRLVERILLCPRHECEHYFIARYHESIHTPRFFVLHSCLPFRLEDMQFSKLIAKISKEFCQIYNQAHKAERYDLMLVAGPGYRKALEFLIKDYVSLLHKEKAEQIKKMPLATCIDKYIDNAKIKSTASRAAWLGNDETHCLRKWEQADLEDLKKFIQLTMYWIEMEELTKEGEKVMPEGKN